METAELRSVGDRYYALRGLLLVPAGLLWIAGGLGNLDSGDGSQILFYVALAVGAAGCLVAMQYYRRRFGQVTRRSRAMLREGMFAAAAVVGVVVTGTVDFNLDLPISTFGAMWGALWLWYYARVVGLRTYHWVLFGGLTLASLVPLWNAFDDKAAATMILIGVVTIAVGPFDHRELVRTFQGSRAGMVDADVAS
jgi:hypothetical protein